MPPRSWRSTFLFRLHVLLSTNLGWCPALFSATRPDVHFPWPSNLHFRSPASSHLIKHHPTDLRSFWRTRPRVSGVTRRSAGDANYSVQRSVLPARKSPWQGHELTHLPRMERRGGRLWIVLMRLRLSATGQLTAAGCPRHSRWEQTVAGQGTTCCADVPAARRVHAELPCHE